MPNKSGRRSPAEQVSFGVSLFIISTIVFLVCYAWKTGDNEPPILSVTTSSIVREAERQYYVPFTVTNSGGETVESVEVVAELLVNNQIAETGRQQIDFLSRREERKGEFVFSRDPRQEKLIVRVASYKLP
ncbi:MAG: TIGR02588 family protein [Pleurocapsa sp. MO_226.B13]|nr:TIGR02588 family protein [Pleurocapsa sp. MO_226.B13]